MILCVSKNIYVSRLSHIAYCLSVHCICLLPIAYREEATLYDLELEPRQLQQLFYDAFPCGLEILEASVKEMCIRTRESHYRQYKLICIY